MSTGGKETHTAMAGLSAQEAQARLDQFGPNEPSATKHYSFLSDLLHVFSNPLVLILVIAAVASAFLGEKVDAGSVLCRLYYTREDHVEEAAEIVEDAFRISGQKPDERNLILEVVGV